jgi:endonuclease YncB( thermonuclease family)
MLMMRKLIILGTLVLVIAFGGGIAQANTIVINGVTLPAGVDVEVFNGVTYAPFRAVVETLDGRVEYLYNEKAFIGYFNGKTVKVILGGQTAYVDGKPYLMANPAVNVDGVAMVPVRFMANVLGLSISYNQHNRIVTISDGSIPSPMAYVEQIEAGDQIYVSMNKGKTKATIKLLGITIYGSKKPLAIEEAVNKMAVEYLKKTILGKTVYLEGDVTDMDEQGNLLRYVWVDKIYADSKFESGTVNAELVKQGLARVNRYPPNTKYVTKLDILERAAKAGNTGYWGLSGWSPLNDLNY